MSHATEFFRNQFSSVLMSINTAMPCKVLSYDIAARTANIQPLFKVKEYGKDPETLQPIEDVPVLFQRYETLDIQSIVETRPLLKSGDTVQVIFNQRAMDDALNGQITSPGVSRVMSVHDAVIVGILKGADEL